MVFVPKHTKQIPNSGEIQIRGQGFCHDGLKRPQVWFGGVEANLVVGSDSYVIHHRKVPGFTLV